MFADVVIPTELFGLLVAIVGAMWSAMVMLWRTDLKRSSETIRDLQARIRLLDALIIETRRTNGVPRVVPPPPAAGSSADSP